VAEDVKFQYVWDVRYVDTPALRDENKDPGTDNDCTEAGDERLYYVSDANFNVTALVDAETGEVVERYMYDPYGKATVLNGENGYDADGQVTEWTADAGGSDWANEILYCGYRFDPESGLYHVRYRYYHPTLGRWLQRDLIGYVDGMSLYQYAGSSAVSRLDSSGLVSGPWDIAQLPVYTIRVCVSDVTHVLVHEKRVERECTQAIEGQTDTEVTITPTRSHKTEWAENKVPVIGLLQLLGVPLPATTEVELIEYHGNVHRRTVICCCDSYYSADSTMANPKYDVSCQWKTLSRDTEMDVVISTRTIRYQYRSYGPAEVFDGQMYRDLFPNLGGPSLEWM